MNLYNADYISQIEDTDFEHASLDTLDDAIRKIMVEDQTDSWVSYGTRGNPFAENPTLTAEFLGNTLNEFKPLCSYKSYIINGDSRGRGNFGSVETLMTWRRTRDGRNELVYLQDHLIDIYRDQLSTLQNRDISTWLEADGEPKRIPASFENTINARMTHEVKQLLKDGKITFFPSSLAEMPKVIRYHEASENFQIIDLNTEPPDMPIKNLGFYIWVF